MEAGLSERDAAPRPKQVGGSERWPNRRNRMQGPIYRPLAAVVTIVCLALLVLVGLLARS